MRQQAGLLCVFLLSPFSAMAVDLGVETPSVGVGDTHDGERRQDLARQQRIESEIRDIQRAGRQLERLAEQEVPGELAKSARQEWQEQSEWLQREADRLADLADELNRHTRPGGGTAGGTDYQRLQSRWRQQLSLLKSDIRHYEVSGEAAAERQRHAVKIISAAY